MDADFNHYCETLRSRLHTLPSEGDASRTDRGTVRLALGTPVDRWTGELAEEAARLLRKADGLGDLSSVPAPEIRATGEVPGLLDVEDGVMTLVSRGMGGKPKREQVARQLAHAGFSYDREAGVWRQRLASLTNDSMTSTEVSAMLGLCRSHTCTPEAVAKVDLQQRRASPGDRFIHSMNDEPDAPLRLAVVFPYDPAIIADFKETFRGVRREFAGLSLGRVTRKCWFLDLPVHVVADLRTFAVRHDLPMIGRVIDLLGEREQGYLAAQQAQCPEIVAFEDKVLIPTPRYDPQFTQWIKGLGVGARFWREGPGRTGHTWAVPRVAARVLAPLVEPGSTGLPLYRMSAEVAALLARPAAPLLPPDSSANNQTFKP